MTPTDPIKRLASEIEKLHGHGPLSSKREELESVLSEAIKEAQLEVLNQNEVIVDVRLKDARNSALEEVSKILCLRCREGKPMEKDFHVWNAGQGQDWSHCDALRILALRTGGGKKGDGV